MKLSAQRGFTPHRLVQGFTLIELLVVIAIIAVLSVVGVAVFQGVTGAANDARRKGDIDAIAKAYEVNSVGGAYQPLTDSQFASGKIPTPPEGGIYTILQNPATTGYQLCAALAANPSRVCTSSSSTCYCLLSSQASSPTSSSYTQWTYNGSPSTICNSSLNTGLIGYWKMDDTSSPFNDSAGNNIGTWAGGVSSTAGKIGNAGNFNGSSAYADIAYSTALDFNKQRISISVWIKPNTTTTAQFIIDHGVLGSNGWGLSLAYQVNNTITFGGHGGCLANSPAILTPNAWHHVVAMGGDTNGATLFYIDGVSYAAASGNCPPTYQVETIPAVNKPIQIGATKDNSNNLSQYFNGLIDDVRVYNRALTSPELQDLYNGCSPF